MLQDQITQASINVDRLKPDLQFVDGQMMAAQGHSRDCTLPQPHDVDQEAFMNLPFTSDDVKDSPPRETMGSALQCSPLEDEDMD